jgi:hypothetical protein
VADRAVGWKKERGRVKKRRPAAVLLGRAAKRETLLGTEGKAVWLELQMSNDCSVCDQDIHPLPAHSLPHDGTGSVSMRGCRMLGICPACKTVHDTEFSDEKWQEILQRVKAMPGHSYIREKP